MSGATLLIDFLAFWRGGAKQPRQLKICPDVEGLDRGLQNKRSKTTLFAQSTRSFWQAVSQQSIVFHNIRNMCHEEGESFSIHIGFRKHGGISLSKSRGKMKFMGVSGLYPRVGHGMGP